MLTVRSARHGEASGGAVHLTSIFTSAPSLPTISFEVTFTVGLEAELPVEEEDDDDVGVLKVDV